MKDHHNYFVKQADTTDLNDAAELFNAYRQFYKQKDDRKGAHAFLSERLLNKESVIFLAVHAETNQAAGFTQLYPSFSSVSMRKTWVLNDLYVDPDHRGCGVAAQLIEHVKQFAHETRAVRVSLSTAINNETAQRLYERTGFQKDQQFFHYAYTL
ncbi:GNAT family N-acetyltransferase [Marinicrinis sediminis]|uniref:GNAT family N-acetyltransferase n=1 Tax=Marinicrinis sediminis TaxID=1652465 RepID=A0ABW5RE99_9BACL